MALLLHLNRQLVVALFRYSVASIYVILAFFQRFNNSLIATYFHQHSSRSYTNYISINCCTNHTSSFHLNIGSETTFHTTSETDTFSSSFKTQSICSAIAVPRYLRRSFPNILFPSSHFICAFRPSVCIIIPTFYLIFSFNAGTK